VHPFERLRYVARAEGAGPIELTSAAAGALAELGGDHAALVTGCRQMLDRHPEVGALWSLASRLLCAADVRAEAWAVRDELAEDPTPDLLADQLPADATVAVVGWPELVEPALRRRADLTVMAVDALGEAGMLAARLASAGTCCLEVPESGLAAAVAASDLVVLEGLAAGPDGAMCLSGSHAAAAVARHAGRGVWLVLGVGRDLPARLWEALCARLARRGDAWNVDVELVPLGLVDTVVTPAEQADVPVAAELFKGVLAPGTKRQPRR